jgi:glycosyltransferase involved in cell wall biosynthesis
MHVTPSTQGRSGPLVSLVIPAYNETDVLPQLFDRVRRALESVTPDHEVIMVDDGSEDGTWEILAEQCQADSRWKAVGLSRNFGHQRAVMAGLDVARGQAVVIMDADLQDPPEIIPQFVDKWREGYDVVYGVRRKRKEGALKRAAYTLFYRVLCRLASVNIPRDSGDFGLMDQRVVGALRRMPERNRFIRGLRAWVGLRQIGLEYERNTRAAGTPKYTFAKLLNLAYTGILSFSHMPLRLASVLGVVASMLGLAWALYILLWRVFSDEELPGYATTMLAILLLGGAQLLCLGVLGEYLGQIYDEVKQRPPYLVASLVGFEEGESGGAASGVQTVRGSTPESAELGRPTLSPSGHGTSDPN